MRPIFETCEPRDEVLSGELKEEIFAARLKDVMDGKAEAVYQDPYTFFDNTYPTSGLKTLLTEALGRLTGIKPTYSPIIRLETAFGGGKTHNLIALYHVCHDHVKPDWMKRLIDPKILPPEPIRKIAGIVGSDLDPDNGLKHKEVTTFTPWGEVAYQLGGVKAYRIVEKSDMQGTAPGAPTLAEIVGEQPVIIMLDEVARFLRVAKGKRVGKVTLADQTIAFLNALLEMAASKANVVVVYTLATTGDAFGKETEEMQKELAEASQISARQERIITPTGETEIAAIVTHRLFRRVDISAAHEAADAYTAYLREMMERQSDLPQWSIRPEYAKEIVAYYPFHPELLNTLNRKTATIPNFQKTRGALRLLAMTIRSLWQKKPDNTYLIHPHSLDLGNEDILNDLTSRLERPAFRNVVEADIISPLKGSPAHAQIVDEPLLEAGKPPYAYRVATTIFLHSLTQGIASGVDPAELHLAVLQPGDDPALVDKALDRLVNELSGGGCWFLDWDGRHYRFKTEPSLNKLVADEMQIIGNVKAKNELDSRIRQIWKKGELIPVYFPTEAGDVSDDADAPKLCIIHYDAAMAEAGDKAPPELATKIFDHAGSLEGYRTYKNNVFFLVADRQQIEHMVEVAQRYLAIRRITGDSERMNEFNDEQRKKLKAMQDVSELDLRVAITRAYRFFYYPSVDAPQKAAKLARETLPAQDQGDIEKDQTTVILRVLKQLDKVLTADDKPMAAAYVKAKAWPEEKEEITTEELRKAFAQRMALKVLLDVNQLKRTIRDGCKQNVWIYYPTEEQMGYGQSSPAPLIQVGEETILYTPQEAKRLGIKIKGEEPKPAEVCPVCLNPADQCTCAKVCPRCGQDPCVCKKSLHAEGAPAQVFQSILDQCHDRGIKKLKRLFIRSEGSGKSAAKEVEAFGIAVPQLGKIQCFVEKQMGAEFGQEEKFSLVFAGGWERYRRVKAVTDAFGKEASKVNVKITLRTDFPGGLEVGSDQFQTMRDVFTTLCSGKLFVDAEQMADEKGGDES